MEETGKSTVKAAEDHVVSEELMRELHDANEQFHQSRQLVEQMMAGTDDQHLERVDKAAEQLRAAERRVEEINEKIHGALKPPPAK